MSRWRIAILLFLIAVPIAVLAGLGSLWLKEHQWAAVAWWPLSACWALAYVLAWHWQRKRRLLPPPELEAPLFWTLRDREAMQLIAKRAEAVQEIKPERLTDFHFYLDTAQQMANELAQ